MSDASHLDYPALIDDAMRHVVANVLRQVLRHGLSGEHHFYISFATGHRGVRISPQLRERFPQEMTIVMQHQFWDLEVTDTQFSIMLSFNNIPEKLVVPFAALTAFADPSTKFGLQFHADASGTAGSSLVSSPPVGTTPEPVASDASDEEDSGAKILSFDAFRKK